MADTTTKEGRARELGFFFANVNVTLVILRGIDLPHVCRYSTVQCSTYGNFPTLLASGKKVINGEGCEKAARGEEGGKMSGVPCACVGIVSGSRRTFRDGHRKAFFSLAVAVEKAKSGPL